LGWSYSAKPIAFSYRRLGEPILFLLFGPALVMGGYYIASGIFPDLKSLVLSLPFGFFTTAILFANEVPDFPQDKTVGKLTWVSLVGPAHSFLLYALLQACAFSAVIIGVRSGYLGMAALFSLVLIFPALKAAVILKRNFREKNKLIGSSGITIKVHAIASLILILSVII
jgi:1,4-dihydroxy-2-naphthoate octaprenyltransferase